MEDLIQCKPEKLKASVYIKRLEPKKLRSAVSKVSKFFSYIWRTSTYSKVAVVSPILFLVVFTYVSVSISKYQAEGLQYAEVNYSVTQLNELIILEGVPPDLQSHSVYSASLDKTYTMEEAQQMLVDLVEAQLIAGRKALNIKEYLPDILIVGNKFTTAKEESERQLALRTLQPNHKNEH